MRYCRGAASGVRPSSVRPSVVRPSVRRPSVHNSYKMLLLFQFSMDFDFNGVVWFIWPHFIILPFGILKFWFLLKILTFLWWKIGISHKMLLLFHFLTDFNLNGFIWFVWALFTILPFGIFEFWLYGKIWDFLGWKIGIPHKTLLLFYFLTESNSNGFVWFGCALFTILPFRILKFWFLGKIWTF